jgi:signal transduction histidine kinase
MTGQHFTYFKLNRWEHFVMLLSLLLISQAGFHLQAQTLKERHDALSDSFMVAYPNNLSLSEKLSDEIYKLATELGDSTSISHAHMNHGLIHFSKGEFNDALEHYHLALTLLSEKHHQTITSIYNNIGCVYISTNECDKAIPWLRNALMRKNAINSETEIAQSYFNLINAFLGANQSDSALHYFNILDEKVKNGLKFDLSNRMSYLATKAVAYYNDSAYTTAAELYHEALKLATENNRIADKALVYFNLGEIYMLQKNYTDAQKMTQLSLDAYRTLQEKSGVRDCLKQLSDIAERTGKYKDALNYHKQYISFNDSINAADKNTIIIEMQEKYESIKKDREIERKNKTIQIQNYRLIIQIVLILFLGLLIAFFYFLLRRYKTQSKTLLKQRDRLEKVNQLKNKLLTIISHDLKGPLGTIDNILIEVTPENLTKEESIQILNSLTGTIHSSYEMLNNTLYWIQDLGDDLKANPVLFNMKSEVERSIHLFKKQADLKQITINSTQVKVHSTFGDVNLTNLIIRNLLSNAVKFTPAGGTIEFKSSANEQVAEVSIFNTGKKIPEETMKQIRTQNFYYSTPGTNFETGSGLGLRLCFEAASKMNASIQIESTDRGTTFTLIIPAKAN